MQFDEDEIEDEIGDESEDGSRRVHAWMWIVNTKNVTCRSQICISVSALLWYQCGLNNAFVSFTFSAPRRLRSVVSGIDHQY